MTFSNFHAERIYLCGVSYFGNFLTLQTTMKLVPKIKLNFDIFPLKKLIIIYISLNKILKMVFPSVHVERALNLIRVFDKIKLNSWQVEILAGESLLSRQTEQFSVFNFIYLNFYKYQLSISLS